MATTDPASPSDAGVGTGTHATNLSSRQPVGHTVALGAAVVVGSVVATESVVGSVVATESVGGESVSAAVAMVVVEESAI